MTKEMPTYYYRVTEFVTTFGAGEQESFTHSEEFSGNDLLDSRSRAVAYFNERQAGLPDMYHLPFATPKDFVMGSNAAYSCSLELVECVNGEDVAEIVLYGTSPEDDAEARNQEAEIFARLNILLNEI